MKPPVLILGATSSIARNVAYSLSKKGHTLFLAGRDRVELEKLSKDINIRSDVPVEFATFDAENPDSCHHLIDEVLRKHQNLVGVVSAFGYLGDQKKGELDQEEALRIMNCNYVGSSLILNQCANFFSDRKQGWILGITSVAGDRGRQSNYLYGSAKGAMSLFLQGLRNRLYPFGVKVITVKLGFVDTKMTFGKPGMFWVASPEKIGEQIASLPESRKDEVYLPKFWSLVMGIIRWIPEKLFKRLKL